MTNTSHYALAFDFGGTKLAAGLVNLENGEISHYFKQPAPSAQGAEVCLQAMVAAGTGILQATKIPRQEIQGIGISFGGIISPDRRTVVKSMHVKNWDAFPLPERVSMLFEMPTFMENDGNAAALGEWKFGSGKGSQNMVYVQVSTGVGSGLIINGKIYRGISLAGEFGHMTVLPDGPDCACGKKGCIESLTSGWAFKKYGQEALNTARPEEPLFKLCAGDPERIDGELLILAYRQGDPQAREIIQRGFKYLGLGISNTIALIDPEIVVLGGGITRAWDVMSPIVQSTIKEYLPSVFPDGGKRIRQSTLNGVETLLGAAMLTARYAD